MSDPVIAALGTMSAECRRFSAGEMLFARGDQVSALFLGAAGRVGLVRHAEDGSAVVLQRTEPGDVLAEASPFSAAYHCDAVAETDGAVQRVPMRHFRDRLRADPAFAEAWVAHLATQLQEARFRGEMLARPTVAARLDAWLAWYGAGTAERGVEASRRRAGGKRRSPVP